MRCRTCEADKEGRITIYPSLNSPPRVRPGILKTIIKKLLGMGNTGKRSTGIPKA